MAEFSGGAGVFNPARDGSAPPTRTAYDMLDRSVRVTLPDASFTRMRYALGADPGGRTRFVTTVTDAEGHRKTTYKDSRELIVALKEQVTDASGAEQTLWTRYQYDPLKQITEVKDAKGHLTLAEYDLLGRRTVLDNKDTGKTEMRYDAAGNLTAKITAKLRQQGQAIRYTYDYNRLTHIRYPNYPANNVTYLYGAPGAADNRAGRLTQVTHQAGHKARWYGKLGETTKETQVIDSGNAVETFTTGYAYDSWGRLHELTYPDGEVLSYTYDAGGNVTTAEGVKGADRFTYLKRLDYDKFGQRVYLALGNGVTTGYTYDARTRRLAQLHTQRAGGLYLQKLRYGYDKVGNILSTNNAVPVPSSPSALGGPVSQTFGYDELYRLTEAKGDYEYSSGKHFRYHLAMQYDNIHNITRKVQTSTNEADGKVQTRTAGTYSWDYTYMDNGHTQPHAPTHIGERTFRYDANGNQSGWTHDNKGARRNIEWDDENRIQTIADAGSTLKLAYDETGQRLVKRGQYGKTVYVNKFYVVTNGSTVSKHVYAGTTRLATQLVTGLQAEKLKNGGGKTTTSTTTTTANTTATGSGTSTATASTPSRTTTSGTDTVTAGVTDKGQGGKAQAKGKGKGKGKPAVNPGQGVAHRSDRANQVAQNTEQNPNLGGEPGNGGDNGGGNGNGNGSGNTGGGQVRIERFLYFYHPDHLGSTSYVTNDVGEVYEHIQYFPFGETWVEETTTRFRTSYLFTSKELDTETGLYYYGARYYDPRTSVWQSADPILAKYFPRFVNGELKKGIAGGLYEQKNIALYTYSHNRPIIMKDEDGNFGIVGAAIGAAIEVGTQMILEGRGVSDLEYGRIVVSAAAGAVTGGFAGLMRGTVTVAGKEMVKATVKQQIVANTMVGNSAAVTANMIKETLKDPGVQNGKAALVKGLVSGVASGIIPNPVAGAMAGEVLANPKGYGNAAKTEYQKATMPVMGDFPPLQDDLG